MDDPSPDDSHAAGLAATAFAAAAVGIAVFDPTRPDLPIVEANPAFATLTGYARCQVVGLAWDLMVGPEVDPAATRAREAIRAGRAATETLRLRRADGTAFRAAVRLSPARDRDGRLAHVVAVVTDASDRAAAAPPGWEAQVLAGVAEASPAILYAYDLAEGRNVWANGRLADVLGVTPEAARAMGPEVLPSLLHPDDLARLGAFRAAAESLADGEVSEIGYRMRHADGGWRWLAGRETPFERDEDGRVRSVVGAALDVTEQREAEARFRALVEHLPAVVTLNAADAGNAVLYASPRVEGMFGDAPADLIADPGLWAARVHPDDRARLRAEVERTVRTGEPFRLEYRRFARDGREVWVRDEGVLIRDEAGRPRHWLSIILDVTDRARAEADLAAERDLLRALMDALPNPVWVKDAASRFLRLNPPAARTLGLDDPAAAIGKTDADFFPPAVAQQFRDDELRVLATGEPVIDKAEAHGEGSSIRWFLTSTSPLREGGRIVGVVGSAREVTAQRRAAEALRRAERRYRDLFAEAPVMYAASRLTDRGPVLVDCNRMFWRTLGFASRADALGRSIADVYAPASLDGVLGGGYAAAMAGRLPTAERQLLTRDGRLIDVLIQAAPDLDESGVACGVRAVYLDVTERNRLQADLRTAEERYRSLVETVPAAVVTWSADPVPTVLFAGPQLEPLLGYAPEEVVGTPGFLWDRLHPDDVARVATAQQRVLDEREPFREEYRVRHKDGRWVWLRDESLPIGDGDGDDAVWHGVLLDIGARKAAETALRESEERYRVLVERLPAVVYLLDNDDRQTPLYFSPRFGDLLGYRGAEALARTEHWLEAVHPDDRARVLAENARSEAADEPFRCDYRHRRADGAWVWVRDECEAMRDEAGRIVAWHGILFDVTEQHRLQEELVAARDAAEEASRLKSAFLSTMSHELRTPLNAVIGYAHLLLDGFEGDLTAAQAAGVRHIAGGADRLLALVNDVLDLSRIGAGMLELAPVPVDLEVAVAAVASEVAPLAAAKGMAVTTAIPPGLAIAADPLRLHQILLNLAGNAVKFTDAGSVRITGRAADGWVEIAVADTGVGIPPTAIPAIFDEFRQVDGSSTRRHGGTGLGLAIAKKLAELHGGGIRVESAPGAGSTFTLTLPAAPVGT